MNKPKSKGGLGRGLSALIPQVMSGTQNEETEKEKGEITIEIKKVSPNPYQPRRTFDEVKMQELTESIREHGVFQPILVRLKEDGYQLIAGERRLRAAKRAGLKAIPAIVREMSDNEMMELAIIENIQRQDLNPVEEAQAYKRLAEEFHLTQEQIARRLSKSRPYIANSIRLLNLPDPVLDLLAEGKLTPGHVRPLLTLTAEQAIQIAQQLAEQKATVREAELWARRVSNPGYFKGGSLERIFSRFEENREDGEEETESQSSAMSVRTKEKESEIEASTANGAEKGRENPIQETEDSKEPQGGKRFSALETVAAKEWKNKGKSEGDSSFEAAEKRDLPVELKEIQRVLRERINTKIEITSGNKGGKIIIDYYTQDDLERILDLFSGKREMD